MSVTVLKAGLLTSLQDGGRPGHAALGVGRAGAMDRPAWRLANALVGNANSEAALEFTLLGPTLHFDAPALVALTGAAAIADADGQPLPGWTSCLLPAGSTLRIGSLKRGCRGYLAVRGGFAALRVLGSRSTDLHARLGPLGGRALHDNDRLELGTSLPLPALTPGPQAQVLRWSVAPQGWFDDPAQPLALLRGSHWDRLDADSQQALLHAAFRISKDANRTAARLDGPRLQLRAPLELISEATLPGTVQLPPSGQPIVLLAEAPVTGGYPRIGQVAAVDLPRLAQRRPGDAVHFREITLDEALQRLEDREQRLERLAAAVVQRLHST
jgi:antagonist of KipI